MYLIDVGIICLCRYDALSHTYVITKSLKHVNFVVLHVDIPQVDILIILRVVLYGSENVFCKLKQRTF